MIRATAIEIVRRLQNAGYEAFWVGGCVRDSLLGREPDDYDIATNALPDTIEKIFPRTIGVGKKFGVMLVIEGGHEFQVATFRAESDYADGRRPQNVTFGDPKADALRRDFTVNGLFFDPIKNETRDWVGGEKDLHAKLIRTVGSPQERFAEDHLRLLRAVRFAAQLDFTIEPETFAAIKSLAPKIKLISAERMRDELIKLFAPRDGFGVRWQAERDTALAPNSTSTTQKAPSPLRSAGALHTPAARGLELLRESGLLPEILPELAATVTCEQSPDFHLEGSVFNHLLLMLGRLPPDAPPSLPWAVLLHDIAKPLTASLDPHTGSIHFYEHERIGADMAEKILERLRFPRKQIDEIVFAVRHHMQFKDAPQMRKATLRRLLLRETFPLELALHRLDCLGSHGKLEIYDFLIRETEALSKQPEIIPPLLTGDDLMAMGVKPGPGMGELLEHIRDKQLAEELKTTDEARQWVRNHLEK